MNKKELNPIANELNEIIKNENKAVYEMLSNFGKRMFFPKGILKQSKEVSIKNPKLKATLGMAVNQIASKYAEVIFILMNRYQVEKN